MSTTTSTTTTQVESIEKPLASLNLQGQQEQKEGENQVEKKEEYKYARFLPTFDPDFKLPPLLPFEHVDPGHQALKHPNPQSFLSSAKTSELTPDFGTEVSGGIQLHKLTNLERSQLALFVARRGVVVFKDQDFIDQDPEWQLRDWGSFFGRLHVHPTSGQPAEFPEFHLIFRDSKVGNLNYESDTKLTSAAWHSDVTYEKQPPGLTTLFLYDSPPSGGDTQYADQRAAYNHLSPSFRAYLETLEVVHSGFEQAEYSRNGKLGGIVKREPVRNIHLLVRRHPVTGEKALFVNKGFSRSIVGLKEEESDAILNLLYAHIAQGSDFQVRIRWSPRTVVLWDNRITAHSATVDFGRTGGRRHGTRITPQAEPPTL